MNKAETIARIGAALEARSGRPWAVTDDRGLLRITAPADRLSDGGAMSHADRAELGELLGWIGPTHWGGLTIDRWERARVVARLEAGGTKVEKRGGSI